MTSRDATDNYNKPGSSCCYFGYIHLVKSCRLSRQVLVTQTDADHTYYSTVLDTMSSVLDRVRQLEDKPSETTTPLEERSSDGGDVAATEPIKVEQDGGDSLEDQAERPEEINVDSEVRTGSQAEDKDVEVSCVTTDCHDCISG